LVTWQIVLFIAAIFAAVAFINFPAIRSNYSPERQMTGAKIGFMLMGGSSRYVWGHFWAAYFVQHYLILCVWLEFRSRFSGSHCG